ncbi:DNA/RNA non-specific endonuclease [Microvirga massiliensis]|uniref:DNA/RNA non-specific endonuclease n=1 Tax=Microvirga massiliensis TaxID=1033741 RepID=UPI00062B6184|nr:DNA/RNA non-specific endonuclease [Microvirga massiliensis]
MLTRAAALAVLGSLACLGAASDASAQTGGECPQFFAQGQAPTLANERLAAKTRVLCYSFFAVLHSGVTRTPLWTAEHLTREDLRRAACIDRVNKFHAETGLPKDERAELSDYVRSGFDRGHLAPAADMPTEDAQDESFSLANMVPQDPTLNRRFWQQVETTVSGLTMRYGETYVVTGVAFRGQNLQSLKGRVLVPTQIFKAVYVPSLEQAGAYVVDNVNTKDWKLLSIDELTALTGIDAFPGLSPAVRAGAMRLPEPSNRGRPRCRDIPVPDERSTTQ